MRYAWLLVLLLTSPIVIGEDVHQTCPFHKEKSTTDHQNCPMHQNHKSDELNQRGDQVMGFSQEKTTHHFLLTTDGGKILVEANDPKDEETILQIRKHMGMVRDSFSNGDFEMPHAVHLEVPPGAETMKKSKNQIQYTYEETAKGAFVIITTKDPETESAIHDFLKFQIVEHQTGDPLKID
jgi:hypothetical protein